jgi:hypothetical protein
MFDIVPVTVMVYVPDGVRVCVPPPPPLPPPPPPPPPLPAELAATPHPINATAKIARRSIRACFRRRNAPKQKGSARLKAGTIDFQSERRPKAADVVETPVAIVAVALEVFELLSAMLVGLRVHVEY